MHGSGMLSFARLCCLCIVNQWHDMRVKSHWHVLNYWISIHMCVCVCVYILTENSLERKLLVGMWCWHYFPSIGCFIFCHLPVPYYRGHWAPFNPTLEAMLATNCTQWMAMFYYISGRLGLVRLMSLCPAVHTRKCTLYMCIIIIL